MSAGRERFARLFYCIFDRGFKVCIFEVVTQIIKPFRLDPGTVDQQCITHFAKDEVNCELGQRKDRRAIKDFAEGLCELFVRDGIGTR